jgi:hypothetical protein
MKPLIAVKKKLHSIPVNKTTANRAAANVGSNAKKSKKTPNRPDENARDRVIARTSNDVANQKKAPSGGLGASKGLLHYRELENTVNRLLRDKNFTPAMLFDSSKLGPNNSIFEVAEYIKKNSESLYARGGMKISRKDKAIISEMADFVVTLRNDNFKQSYVEDFVKYRLMIREQCPLYSDMCGKNGYGEEENENASKCMNKFAEICQKTIKSNFSPAGFFESYFQARADKVLAFNLLVSRSMNIPDSNYFWICPYDEDSTKISPKGAAEKQLNDILARHGISERQAMQALAAWHALSMELMKTVDIPGKTDDNKIYLLRVEVDHVLSKNRITPSSSPESTRKMNRSAMACSCAGACATQFGQEITLYKAPFHRVIGGYFMPALQWTTANTMMIIPNNLPFEHFGSYSEGIKPTPNMAQPVGGVESESDKIMRDVFGIFRRYDSTTGKILCGFCK